MQLNLFRLRLRSISRLSAMILWSLLATASVAQAQVTVEQFQAWSRGLKSGDAALTETLRLYLHGTLDGLKSIIAAYERAGAKPPFCMPQNPPVTTGDLLLAIDAALANGSYKKDDELKMVILSGLNRRYRCQ
jgi:hypothetical protein